MSGRWRLGAALAGPLHLVRERGEAAFSESPDRLAAAGAPHWLPQKEAAWRWRGEVPGSGAAGQGQGQGRCRRMLGLDSRWWLVCFHVKRLQERAILHCNGKLVR